MSAANPFELVLEYDQRCRANARGLPTANKVVDDWVGIGFRLCGERLIAPMNEVAEILPRPDTIRVPGVLDWVKGLANIRGNLMPVLDMNQYLSEAPIDRRQSRVLVINTQGVEAALLVEEVYGLRRFKPEMKRPGEIQAPSSLRPYLNGIFDDSQSLWGVFSVEKLVGHEQFMKVV